jgi:hypothetical protein
MKTAENGINFQPLLLQYFPTENKKFADVFILYILFKCPSCGQNNKTTNEEEGTW